MQAVGHAIARLGVQYEGYLAIHRAATCHHARMQWRGHGACAQRCSEGGYVPSAWIATSFGDVATGDYRVPTCPALVAWLSEIHWAFKAIIAAIHYNRNRAYIRHVFTHPEYDQWSHKMRKQKRKQRKRAKP